VYNIKGDDIPDGVTAVFDGSNYVIDTLTIEKSGSKLSSITIDKDTADVSANKATFAATVFSGKTNGSDVAATLKWDVSSYTFKASANGQSVESYSSVDIQDYNSANKDVSHDIEIAMPTDPVSKNGYTFLGWSVDSAATTADFFKDDSNANYVAEVGDGGNYGYKVSYIVQKVEKSTKTTLKTGDTITLYAVWKTNQTANLTVNVYVEDVDSGNSANVGSYTKVGSYVDSSNEVGTTIKSTIYDTVAANFVSDNNAELSEETLYNEFIENSSAFEAETTLVSYGFNQKESFKVNDGDSINVYFRRKAVTVTVTPVYVSSSTGLSELSTGTPVTFSVNAGTDISENAKITSIGDITDYTFIKLIDTESTTVEAATLGTVYEDTQLYAKYAVDGDVNLNGKFTSADPYTAYAILKYKNGSYDSNKVADINRNGNVDAADALGLLAARKYGVDLDTYKNSDK
jgi:uncharacterized repeat protein (TIGR02543 family)